jgi:hypothetical protein
LGPRSALQQRDHDDVGPELLDRAEGLGAVIEDVEQLDPALGIEEAADMLRHLGHVLDEQQARLV